MPDDKLITDLHGAFAAQVASLPQAGPQARPRPRTHAGVLTATGLGVAAVTAAGVGVAVAGGPRAPGPDLALGSPTTTPTGITTTTPAAGVTIELAGHLVTLPAGFRADPVNCDPEPLAELAWPGTVVARIALVGDENGTCIAFYINATAVAAPDGAQPVTVDGLTGWTTVEPYGRVLAVPLPSGFTVVLHATPAGSVEEAVAILDRFDVDDWFAGTFTAAP